MREEMRINKAKEMMKGGKKVVGTFCVSNSRAVIETMLKSFCKPVIVFLLFSLIIGLAIMPVLSANEDPIKLVIATDVTTNLENNEVYLSLVYFKDIVEAETKGNIQVEIYANGTLGTELETVKEVQAGGVTIQASTAYSGVMASIFPEYQILTCPFIFPDYTTAWAFFDSDFNLNLMEQMQAETGLRYLGTFDDGGGFVAITNGKRLIKTMEDMKGLRIRVEENPAHIAIIESFGAKAVPLEFSQLPTCLATGVADGQFNAPGVNAWMKFWELLPYTTWTGHTYNSKPLLISDEWFNNLSENYQKIILRAAREALLMSRGNAARITLLAWEECKQNFEDAYKLTADEKKEWAKVARPAFRKWFVEDFKGDEKLLDSFINEVERIYNSLGKK